MLLLLLLFWGRADVFGSCCPLFILLLFMSCSNKCRARTCKSSHLYAHCGDLRQFPVSSFGNLLLVLAAKQRIESIRRILSSERAKEFTEVSRLRMQDLETALKHLILNILTTTTFKEKSEGAILDMVIKAACKPQASAEGKKL